jgi:hypothetical protein
MNATNDSAKTQPIPDDLLQILLRLSGKERS